MSFRYLDTQYKIERLYNQLLIKIQNLQLIYQMLVNNPQSSSLVPQSNKNGQDSSSSALKSSKQKNGLVENAHKLSLKCIRSLGPGYLSEDVRVQQQEVKINNKTMKKVSKKMQYKKQNPEQSRPKQIQKVSEAQKSIESILQNISLDQITLQTANKDEQNLLQQQQKNERIQQKQENNKNIINVNANTNINTNVNTNVNTNFNNECQQLLLSGLQLSSYSSCLKSMPNLECIGLENVPSTGSKVNNKYSQKIGSVNRDKVGNKDREKNQVHHRINFFEEISKIQCKLHSDNITSGTGNRNKMARNNAGKKMEIICLECQKILCAHCVIFGGNKDQNHKKHKVLSIQQFILDIKTIIEYCKNPQISLLESQQQQQKQSETELPISVVAPTVPIKHVVLNKKLHESYNRDYSKISSQISVIIERLRQHEATLHKQLDEYYTNLNIIYEEEDANLRQMEKYTRQIGTQILKIIENVNLANIIVNSESIISMLYTSNNRFKLSAQQILNRLQTQTSNTLPEPSVTVQVKPSIQRQISEMLMLQTRKIDAKQSLTVVKQNQTKNENNKFLHNLAKSNEAVEGSSKLKKRTHLKRLTEVQGKQDCKEETRRSNPKLTQSMISKARSVDNFNKPTQAKQKIRNFASPPRPTSNLLYSQKKVSKQVEPSSSFRNNAEFSTMSIQSSILLEQESQSINLSSSILTLSNQNLTDQRLIATLKKYLGSSSNRKQIKSLKLCFNLITDEGFATAIEFLGNMTNLNLSNNLLTERSLDIVLKNKDKLAPLRLLNLRGNKCTKGVHTKSKVQALSKMGVVVCLSD